MKLFTNIKNSIYGPDYYVELRQNPLSYSFKYYFKLAFLIALAATIVFSITALPNVYSAVSKIQPVILENYPDELEVTIKNGKVSTNTEGPYYFEMPEAAQSDEDTQFKNLIVIDTASMNIDDINKYDTLLLITETHLIARESNGEIRANSLEKISNFTLNKSIITEFIERANPILKLLIPFIALLVFLGVYFVLLLELVYLLLLALLIWLVATIKKADIGYGKAYQLGLHLVTLPLIIVYLIPYLPFVFLYTILTVILAAVNITNRTYIIHNKNTEDDTNTVSGPPATLYTPPTATARPVDPPKETAQ